jgi:hypothetical protein
VRDGAYAPILVAGALPPDTTAYLDALVARLQELLRGELVGVYAGGSLALGGFAPHRSDIDIAVVCRRSLTDDAKTRIAAALRHEALPCPARGLELVVYAEPTVRAASRDAGYELNLNTGRSMPYHFSPAPHDGAAHWYALDRAIVREHGVALVGPLPGSLFAPLPRQTLVELLAESVRWHAEAGVARADDAILNACRALRFAIDDTWVSKPAAAAWARPRVDDPALVDAALAARRDGRPLDRARVERLLRSVSTLLTRAPGSL